MLMRTDPFREFDRLTQQLLGAGTTSRPAVMPMDAWREGETFVVEFDLPGVQPETLDIDVERNVLTVKAERPARPSGRPGCSVASSCSVTTWTWSGSTPAMTPAC
jgi:HSP20 family protein